MEKIYRAVYQIADGANVIFSYWVTKSEKQRMLESVIVRNESLKGQSPIILGWEEKEIK